MKKPNGKFMTYSLVIVAATSIVVSLFLGFFDTSKLLSQAAESSTYQVSSNTSGSIELPIQNPKALEFKDFKERKLFKGKYLELVGGYSVPMMEIDGMFRISSSLDLLPGTNRWLTGHPKGYLIELTEPSKLGTGSSDKWPALKIGKKHRALHNIRKISPTAVLWLNEKEALTSGRKSYRSGFTPTWLSKVNLETGQETRYPISAQSNTKRDNFKVLQALGSGFMRITNQNWAQENLNGIGFLLGRGGYDVLGSPLGPSLGYWEIGKPHPQMLLDFPHESHPARRDPYYSYPAKDPNTYAKAQLPMWKKPDEKGGFWQAGSVGGLAFINHPSVKGIVVTHNHGRGIHDYRAQGDAGSDRHFLVKEPDIFYTKRGKGNRGGHAEETGNSTYPKGLSARVGHVFDPSHLADVFKGNKRPWEAELTRFEWPKKGLIWQETARISTKLGSITWDNERQLLWVVTANHKRANLAAYKIIADDSRPEEPIHISDEWLEIYNARQPQK